MSATASLGVRGRGYDIGKIRELSELQLKDPLGSSFHDSVKNEFEMRKNICSIKTAAIYT